MFWHRKRIFWTCWMCLNFATTSISWCRSNSAHSSWLMAINLLLCMRSQSNGEAVSVLLFFDLLLTSMRCLRKPKIAWRRPLEGWKSMLIEGSGLWSSAWVIECGWNSHPKFGKKLYHKDVHKVLVLAMIILLKSFKELATQYTT